MNREEIRRQEIGVMIIKQAMAYLDNIMAAQMAEKVQVPGPKDWSPIGEYKLK